MFSFGAVVYRALTGQPPFSGPDTPQILYQVVYRNPARPSQLVPGLPPDVEMVLAIAMAKDPGDRFASALEMAEALRAAREGHARSRSTGCTRRRSSRRCPGARRRDDESEVELIEVSE